MIVRSKNRLVGFALLALLVGLVAFDVSRRAAVEGVPFSWVKTVSAGPEHSVVGIARSDDAELSDPAPSDSSLTYAQVKALVRRSVKLSGGLESVIGPEDHWIVVKPNVVEMVPEGSPVNSDIRVVKAVVELVYETAPEAKITIAEGPGGWTASGHEEQIGRGGVDGFTLMGYTDLLAELRASGINVDLVDLNFDEVAEVPVPGGGYSAKSYWYPRTIRECDVLINVPKMKVHNEPGITVSMKNMVGTAPGIKYGWSKSQGRDGNPGIPHSSPVVDETIVDLNLLAGIDFSVVDAIVCMEKDKSFGNPVRMNLIVTGRDVVAVDAVCARLMNFNPDDIEYISLGAQAGLGTSDFSKIQVRGRSIEETYRRFEKAERWTGNYGQSNRIWTVKGPFQTTDPEREFVDAAHVRPIPGEDGWSAPVYFHHDKIDLDAYYHDPVDCAVYAYTEFTAPKTQEAELWIGSDESIKVWLNGEAVYAFGGARRHRLPNDEAPINIRKGRNTLLVKENQQRGKFDFSLNICEPEPDDRYDGNRVFGLKFVLPGKTLAGHETQQQELTALNASDLEDYDFGDPYVFSTIEGVDVLEAGEQAPEKEVIAGFPMVTAESVPNIIAYVQAIFAYRGEQVELAYLRGASGGAFRFYYSPQRTRTGADKWPDHAVENICDLLGYSYAISFNENEQISWTRLKGWIHSGYPVVIWPAGRGSRIVLGYEDEGYVVHVRRAGGGNGTIGNEYETVPMFLNQWKSGWASREKVVGYPKFVIGKKIQRISSREAILRSLRGAVALAREADTVAPEGTIHAGFRAYEIWIGELRKISHKSMDDRARSNLMSFNGNLLPTLISDRDAAARFLKKIAENFQGADQDALSDASVRYGLIAAKLKEIEALVPQGNWRAAVFTEQELLKFANYPQVIEKATEAYAWEREAIGMLERVTAER
ncbi:MAG: DUF362 domain-containing protein [Candidatus Latescibacterota bacterium]